MKTFVIMLAGGSGSRMNLHENKILMSLCGKTVIRRSMEAFRGFADEMVIVSKPDEHPFVLEQISKASLPFIVRFASAGKTRQESVHHGLRSLDDAKDEDIVLIHDAARCLVDSALIERVITSVKEYGTGIPGLAVTSTYKICNQDLYTESTPDRSRLYEIQTPQGFRAGLVVNASQKAMDDHIECTDDAGLLEYSGIPVKIVPGSVSNLKLTVPDDIRKASAILEGGKTHLRAGMGYDVHQLVPDRKLILCGVEINHDLGLLGHSDADVALHALMDAMLGACGLGDIGRYFPDTDKRWEGASSVDLLKKVNQMIQQHGFYVANADITIVAQRPKLLPYIENMAENIRKTLSLPENTVNVKATTTEHLGFVGRMEGISSYAICTVEEKRG